MADLYTMVHNCARSLAMSHSAGLSARHFDKPLDPTPAEIEQYKKIWGAYVVDSGLDIDEA